MHIYIIGTPCIFILQTSSLNTYLQTIFSLASQNSKNVLECLSYMKSKHRKLKTSRLLQLYIYVCMCIYICEYTFFTMYLVY